MNIHICRAISKRLPLVFISAMLLETSDIHGQTNQPLDAFAAARLGLPPPPDSALQDQFALTWRGTGYSVSAGGKVVSTTITETNIVEQAAEINNLDPSTLILVYRVERHDAVIARISNGAFVAPFYQFYDGKALDWGFNDVGRIGDTAIRRNTVLVDKFSPSPIGMTSGTEAKGYDQNGNLIRYSYIGTLTYMTPNPATPVSPQAGMNVTGAFSTSGRVSVIATNASDTIAPARTAEK